MDAISVMKIVSSYSDVTLIGITQSYGLHPGLKTIVELKSNTTKAIGVYTFTKGCALTYGRLNSSVMEFINNQSIKE